MSTASLRSPEVLEGDFERFLVHDRFEILSILRRLQARREPVTLNMEGEGFVLTILLAVNPDFEEMVFDCGADAEANRRVMRAERITLVANLDGVKVQFSARKADATIFEGGPALRMRLPDIVLRLQRRDYYRVPASLACEVTLDGEEEKVKVLEMRVADLSLGGLALTTDKTYVRLEVGQRLETCRIDLGALGVLTVDLEVKNLADAKNRNGVRTLRVGCEFAGLSRQSEALLSRYISQKERERRM